jgi:hypothetical protein
VQNCITAARERKAGEFFVKNRLLSVKRGKKRRYDGQRSSADPQCL